eukprot:CAMPEP_0172192588 /NCGR_PEP_ID=MMETSP1050-20130122/24421_1 /TAXON_ID=233186 /ORGANISM="Cryptomonas curvata, Strain CCAP979/52" /LENGTH=168 /DNA_ID=CAMNT_0012867927 /DNA_START=96 /DNA_END=601 /DNA_ORIENTATION=+
MTCPSSIASDSAPSALRTAPAPVARGFPSRTVGRQLVPLAAAPANAQRLPRHRGRVAVAAVLRAEGALGGLEHGGDGRFEEHVYAVHPGEGEDEEPGHGRGDVEPQLCVQEEGGQERAERHFSVQDDIPLVACTQLHRSVSLSPRIGDKAACLAVVRLHFSDQTAFSN